MGISLRTFVASSLSRTVTLPAQSTVQTSVPMQIAFRTAMPISKVCTQRKPSSSVLFLKGLAGVLWLLVLEGSVTVAPDSEGRCESTLDGAGAGAG